MSLDDLSEAEIAVIRFSQRERLHNEIVASTSSKSEVKKDSAIYKLDPFLEDGLLKVGIPGFSLSLYGLGTDPSQRNEKKHIIKYF